MRKLALIVGLALVTGMIPVASASHLSAGAYDSVGTQPQETPNDDDRTVPGTSIGDPDTQYGVGTTRADTCHDPSGDISADEIQATAEANGFCGMLIYQEGDVELEQVSKPDQDLRGPITTFDVVRAHTVSGGAGTCLPFCPDGEGQPAGGDEAFELFHTAGEAAGLTDGPEEADEEEPADRSRAHSVFLHHASPRQVVQDTTGFWEMNGWWWPTAFSTFVAFVEEDGGVPVDDDRLKEIVTDMKGSGDLHPNSEAAICAYTPDFQFTTVAPDAAGLNCEFEFSYEYASDSGTTFDGYEDPCESPAYVCGAANGAAWYSQGCVCLGLLDPKIPGSDPLPGPESPLAGPEGQTDYIRWHHVIAPHNSLCGGAQEPGFSFSGDGASNPYLGHDVDVFGTVGSTSVHPAGASVPEFLDYSDAVAESFTGQVGPTIDDAEDAADEIIASLPGTPGDVDAAVANVLKGNLLEPNLATDRPVAGLDDTSRQTEIVDRTLDNPCDRLFTLEPTEATLDPWVDYIDNEAVGVQDAQIDLTYASDERISIRPDNYGNSETEQDDSNRPGPSLYTTAGKVGIFTDTDDDGEYDQNEAGVKYNSINVRTRGAYPMMWNMWVDDQGNVDDSEDPCSLGDTTMPEAMAALGYGPNTGLVQAVYLNEPTAFVHSSAAQALPYAEGNNIYLMMSQAARQLYEPDEDEANPLDTEIERLVEELESYVTDDLGREAPSVHVPGEEIGLTAAFTNQCSGHTGNFQNTLQFVHDCSTDCSGDTIATMYTYEVASEGTLDGSEALPTFSPEDVDAYDFGTGQHTWLDIDPFDNDPDRDEQRQAPPPNPEAGHLGEGMT